MNRNYQKELDELLVSLGTKRPRLLLHACCAPCASYVLSYLAEHFEITLLYYNPNIRPLEEYERRLFWLRRLLEGMGLAGSVPLMVPDYETERFSSACPGWKWSRKVPAAVPFVFVCASAGRRRWRQGAVSISSALR